MRLPELRDAVVQRVLRRTLSDALAQPFPGTLTLECACTAAAHVDHDLTGGDLVAVGDWLNAHSRHGERRLVLELPAGTDTTVRLPL